MQLFSEELALANLKGEIDEEERGFLPREGALAWLREMSGSDFGPDIAAWEEWVKETLAEKLSKFVDGKPKRINQSVISRQRRRKLSK